MRFRHAAILFATLLVASPIYAAEPPKERGSPAGRLAHMVALPDDLKWGPARRGSAAGSEGSGFGR